VPEVVRNGILVELWNAEALADGILRLYRDPDLRASLGEAACQDVEEFEMLRVAKRFLAEVAKIAPGVKVAEGYEVEHPA
jgi:glycosyltransferase involved in cell wall biosynthesis